LPGVECKSPLTREIEFYPSACKLEAMARIYTRTGDTGDTGLVGGARERKNSPLIDAIGEVDETNAAIGCAASECADGKLADLLARIQSDLFDLGAIIADPEGKLSQPSLEPRISRLEAAIDSHQEQLPPLKKFILPGGSPLAARLHLARSVCRRAERALVGLAQERLGGPVKYLNRLSDLLFVLARTANHRAGVSDVEWTQEDAKE